ncbi:MAG: hypothetical protein ACOCVF_01835 [bacterium]
MDEFFPDKYFRVWNKEKCQIEALKYNSRGKFFKGSKHAYERSRIEGWLDEFFPKTKKATHN